MLVRQTRKMIRGRGAGGSLISIYELRHEISLWQVSPQDVDTQTSAHILPSIHISIYPHIHPHQLHSHSHMSLLCFLGAGLWVLGGWVVLAPSGVALINSESVLRVLPKGQICVHDSCPVVKWACYGCPYSLAPHCRKLWKIFPNKSGKTSCPSEKHF